ncbi:MAG: sensor domain-containing diguanylate cyclase [Fusobacteria bacterium]|nr:sensor domain-containing diguanylate cyclase [Fusobacteriota bacterium]
MKKILLKNFIIYTIVFVVFLIVVYPFMFNYLYRNEIFHEQMYINSKNDYIKENINDQELINFRNNNNIDKIFYVNNKIIIHSSLITEKGNVFEYDKLNTKYNNIQEQKTDLKKNGSWVKIGKDTLRYYLMVDDNSFLIIEKNFKDRINYVNQNLKIIYLMLSILFFIIFITAILYKLSNFYIPINKFIKKIKNIDKLENYEINSIIKIDNITPDFNYVENEIMMFLGKTGERIDKIERDRQAMKKVYETMMLKNKQMLSLYEFAKTLSFDLELSNIYNKIVEIMTTLMKTKVIVVILLKQDKTYDIDYIYGIKEYKNNLQENKLEDDVFSKGQLMKVRDLSKEKRLNFNGMDTEDKNLLSTCIYIPLKNINEINGIMVIDGIFDEKLSNAEESMTLITIGEIIGKAINKAQKYKEMNIGLNITSMLYRITTLVETNKNLDEIFQHIIKAIKKVVDYTSASIYLLNEKNELKEKPEYREGEKDEILESIEFKLGNGIKALVAQKKETIIIKDARKSSKDFSDIFSDDDKMVASFASVPMIVGDKLVGVLNLSHKEPYKFREEDKQILKVFANQVASTISKILSDKKLEELLAKVTNESITDPLTQAYNRRYMMRRLTEEMERAKREKKIMGLLALDIDFFKKLNDSYGHQAGDYVLQQVTDIIKKSVRVIDIVCRYGGEEFFVILPSTTKEGCIITAERIRKSIESNKMLFGDSVVGVTVSIGISLFPVGGDTIEQMIKSADMALYQAKERGRNRVISYGE